MKKRLFILTAVLFLSSITGTQAAQVLFTPALVLSEQYTDNLFLDYQNEEDDLISAAGIDLAGQILWRTAGLELKYNPTYNSYKENNYLDYWRQQAGLYVWKEFTRSTILELQDSYLRTNDPEDESEAIVQNEQPQTPIIEADRNRRGRNEYYTNVAEANLKHLFGVNDYVSIGYKYGILRDVDTNEGFAAADNDIATSSIALSYDLSQKWAVAMGSSYAMTDYKEQNDRDEYWGNIRLLYRFDRAFSGFANYRHTMLFYDQDTGENYNIYEPSVGIRYDFENNTQVEMAASYYIQDFETSDDEDGFGITSDINKRWDYRTGYTGISGSSGYVIDDDGIEDNGLDIYYLGRLEAGYNFTSMLTGLVHGGYRHDRYPNETPERTEITTTAGLELKWKALQWMVIGLSYDFSDVDSDNLTDNYTETRALLTFRIGPSSPYRLN